MQSVLQYRRLRATVEAQLERDKARVGAYKTQGTQQPTTQRSVSSSDESKQDLEKGIERDDFEHRNQTAPRHPRHPNAVDLEASTTKEQEADMVAENRRREEHEERPKPEEESDDDADDYELEGIRTVSSRTTTMSAGSALGTVLTGIQVRRRTTKEGGDGNVFVVGYEGPDDPNDPHNWPKLQRLFCTFLIASISLVMGMASSIDSGALPQAARDFGVSEVVESMATGLFLIGFGCGALFAGPFSETVGRNPVYIVTMAIYMCFILGAALSPNIGAQLAFRWLAGFFASTPLVCAGGSISDLWSPLERVYAFPMFANAGFLGPVLGPMLGGYIGQSHQITWRWTEWATLIFSGLILGVLLLFLPETYPPTLLKWKAEHLRAITGDERYRAAIEIRKETFTHRLLRALDRPFILTSREPIIMIFALYLTVVYIILFTFLDGYTYVFQDTYGISQGLTGICFAGIMVGLFCASALVPMVYSWAKRDLRKIEEAGGTRLPPEFRLWYAMLGGGLAIPVSLFWMGWTAYPHISIWSPLVASVLFGYGILCIFLTSYQYIIDSYEMYAASALSSITLIRYVAAGGMTIVGVPFYQNMGVHYTCTILACISIPLVPAPYILFRYGPWIRSKSKYAVNETTGQK